MRRDGQARHESVMRPDYTFRVRLYVNNNIDMPVLDATSDVGDLDIGSHLDDFLDPAVLPPARITIRRQSAHDIGCREIYVLLDGEDFAELTFGNMVTREVDAGPHRLRAHNTLFRKTHEIVLGPGEHRQFTVVNRAGWGTVAMLGVLGVGPLYLTFAPHDDERKD